MKSIDNESLLDAESGSPGSPWTTIAWVLGIDCDWAVDALHPWFTSPPPPRVPSALVLSASGLVSLPLPHIGACHSPHLLCPLLLARPRLPLPQVGAAGGVPGCEHSRQGRHLVVDDTGQPPPAASTASTWPRLQNRRPTQAVLRMHDKGPGRLRDSKGLSCIL